MGHRLRKIDQSGKNAHFFFFNFCIFFFEIFFFPQIHFFLILFCDLTLAKKQEMVSGLKITKKWIMMR